MLERSRVQLTLFSDASESAASSDKHSFPFTAQEKTMSSLRISIRQVQGVVIVDLDGKILIGDTNRQVHETVNQLIKEGKKNIILNLARVSVIDSSGLGEIVASFSSLRNSGGSMKLVNIPERVVDLMTITKLYTVFDIFETESDGIASFEPEEVKITEPLDKAVAADAFAHSPLL